MAGGAARRDVIRRPVSLTMQLMSEPADATGPQPAVLRELLREVIDPEVGLDMIDLGLLYRLEYIGGALEADMTMTSPACPVTTMMAAEVERILRAALPAGTPCRVRVVWEPPWGPERISDAGRSRLGW